MESEKNPKAEDSHFEIKARKKKEKLQKKKQEQFEQEQFLKEQEQQKEYQKQAELIRRFQKEQKLQFYCVSFVVVIFIITYLYIRFQLTLKKSNKEFLFE